MKGFMMFLILPAAGFLMERPLAGELLTGALKILKSLFEEGPLYSFISFFLSNVAQAFFLWK